MQRSRNASSTKRSSNMRPVTYLQYTCNNTGMSEEHSWL